MNIETSRTSVDRTGTYLDGILKEGRLRSVVTGVAVMPAPRLGRSSEAACLSVARCLRRNIFSRNAGDWIRQTAVTTSALKSRFVSGGMPIE